MSKDDDFFDKYVQSSSPKKKGSVKKDLFSEDAKKSSAKKDKSTSDEKVEKKVSVKEKSETKGVADDLLSQLSKIKNIQKTSRKTEVVEETIDKEAKPTKKASAKTKEVEVANQTADSYKKSLTEIQTFLLNNATPTVTPEEKGVKTV